MQMSVWACCFCVRCCVRRLTFDTFQCRYSLHTPAMMQGPQATRAVYDSLCLRSLRSSAHATVPAAATERVRQLGLRRHRGCQAGRRSRRPVFRLRSVGNGAYVVPVTSANTAATPGRRCCVSRSDRFNVPIRTLCHTVTSRPIVFGSMNVASLSPSRLEDRSRRIAGRSGLEVACLTARSWDRIALRAVVFIAQPLRFTALGTSCVHPSSSA